MADSYICSKARIKCTFGDKISTLTVLPARTVWLTGQPQGNISDHLSMVNIAPFGRCHTTAYPPTGAATAAAHGKLTPMPCVPGTVFPWMGGKNDVLVQGQPALLRSSTCRCQYGGTISFTMDGQTDTFIDDTEHENKLSQEELDEDAEIELSPEDILDAVQLALDAAGMFPGLGAIPDLLNACISAVRGNWGDAALSIVAAVPGIGDAAAAGKLMKNSAKMAAKTKKAQKIAKAKDVTGSSASIATKATPAPTKVPSASSAQQQARFGDITINKTKTAPIRPTVSTPAPAKATTAGTAQPARFGELTRPRVETTPVRQTVATPTPTNVTPSPQQPRLGDIARQKPRIDKAECPTPEIQHKLDELKAFDPTKSPTRSSNPWIEAIEPSTPPTPPAHPSVPHQPTPKPTPKPADQVKNTPEIKYAPEIEPTTPTHKFDYLA